MDKESNEFNSLLYYRLLFVRCIFNCYLLFTIQNSGARDTQMSLTSDYTICDLRLKAGSKPRKDTDREDTGEMRVTNPGKNEHGIVTWVKSWPRMLLGDRRAKRKKNMCEENSRRILFDENTFLLSIIVLIKLVML